MNGLQRLIDLQTEAQLGAEELAGHAHRFSNLADPGSAPRAVSSFNLFQTPPDIAEEMAELLDPQPGQIILEPSAGLGRLVNAVRDARGIGPMVLVELSAELCSELRFSADEECTILQGDFMAADVPLVDGVIMNPPFKRGLDVKHILRAYDLLREGGRLVSLCFDGAKQNKELRPLVDSWRTLPAGSFKREGTSAGVAMIVMEK